MRESRVKEIFDCVPEIDYDSGYRYFLGNMKNYSQALLAILKSIKSKLPLLQSMRITGEYEGLRSILLILQKMFTSIGAKGLAEVSYQMEKSLLNNEIELTPELLDDYINRLAAFSGHLEQLFCSADFGNILEREADTQATFRYDFTNTRESIKKSSDLLERRIIS